MLMLVFVFMLLNLTSIWKLPTFSIGGHGRDGVPRIIGPREGSLSTVALEKRPQELSPSGGSHQQRFYPMLLRTVR